MGCNGLLGQKLSLSLGSRWVVFGAGRQVVSPVRTCLQGYVRLDITARDEVLKVLAVVRPEWVVNTAAMADVDECELDPRMAFAVNVRGVDHLIEGCQEEQARLVHISTNYVFDGRHGAYAEDDEANPINVYGRTKLEGERLLQESGLEHLIVRTVLLYGWVPSLRSNAVERICSHLQRGEQVRAATDLWANPTLVDDVARGIETALDRKVRGILHLAGSQPLSRYDMARLVAESLGFDGRLVRPVETAQLDLPARRPLRSDLRTGRAQAELSWTGSSIVPGLRIMREQIEAQAGGTWS